jgi:hypothetical protein
VMSLLTGLVCKCGTVFYVYRPTREMTAKPAPAKRKARKP